MRRIFILLSLVSLALSVQVRRCCSDGLSLSHSSSGPQCGGDPHTPLPLPTVPGLDLTGDRREVEIPLEDGQDRGLPVCQGGLEVYTVRGDNSSQSAWVTSNGQLVSRKYEAEFSHGEFCVDYNSGGELQAVMCDPCHGQMACINLCCPHGHAMVIDDEYRQYCRPQPGGVQYSPEVWDTEEEKMLEWERNNHYVLVAPPLYSPGPLNSTVPGFACPNPEKKHRYVRQWADDELGQYRISKDGSLQGTNLPDYVASTDGSVTKSDGWPSDHFCLIFGSPPSYDYDDEGGGGAQTLRKTFMTCYDTDPYILCNEFTKIFHPIALILSILCLLLVLTAYILEPSLREPLMGKMTIFFVFNLTICFIIMACLWFEAAAPGPLGRNFGCSLAGYLVQYHFLAFFFWLNAMAINIYLPFSSYGRVLVQGSEKKRLILSTLYAQGLPLIICAITAIVDSTGTELLKRERLAYPNMGDFTCFLGAQRTANRSYFAHPVFIYFHSVVLLLQLSNLILMGLSAKYLCWSGQDSGQKDRMKGNMVKFIKFFIIMGFYWTADMLSSALGIEYGHSETCLVRIFVDLTSLFSGLLIFWVLIGNKTVLSALLRRARGKEEPGDDLQEMEETRVQD